jgi:hypothetical protein
MQLGPFLLPLHSMIARAVTYNVLADPARI